MLTPKILRENPVAFVAFDIVYRDGELLMERPLRQRRAELESLLPPLPQGEGGGEGAFEHNKPLVFDRPLTLTLSRRERGPGAAILITRTTAVSTAEQIDRAFCIARDCRNEGLVLKDPESTYAPGRRGKTWLKLKTHLPTFDCVVTAAEYGHGKRRGVLSDYTFAVWDREPTESGATLVNVGKAYSGVTDEEIARLTEIFLGVSRQQYGSVHVVEPRIVLEIACDQIQRSQRHASGYALRFPRIKRIRWDKRPEDADRLARVVEIYNSAANFAKREIIEEPKEPTLFD